MDARDFIIHHDSNDSAAVYVNGKRVRIGDTSDIREYVLEELGVRMVWDSSFMLGQTSYAKAADNLEEIEQYETKRAHALDRIARLQGEIDQIRKDFPK